MKNTKTLTARERRKQLRTLATISDERIDTSDIPELSAEQMRRAVRGRWYRPLNKPVTMRLDVDVIEWLKRNGRGYQTQANRLLREEMLRSYRKKAAQSENLREHPWTPLNPIGLRYFPQFWSGSWL